MYRIEYISKTFWSIGFHRYFWIFFIYQMLCIGHSVDSFFYSFLFFQLLLLAVLLCFVLVFLFVYIFFVSKKENSASKLFWEWWPPLMMGLAIRFCPFVKWIRKQGAHCPVKKKPESQSTWQRLHYLLNLDTGIVYIITLLSHIRGHCFLIAVIFIKINTDYSQFSRIFPLSLFLTKSRMANSRSTKLRWAKVKSTKLNTTP